MAPPFNDQKALNRGPTRGAGPTVSLISASQLEARVHSDLLAGSEGKQKELAWELKLQPTRTPIYSPHHGPLIWAPYLGYLYTHTMYKNRGPWGMGP